MARPIFTLPILTSSLADEIGKLILTPRGAVAHLHLPRFQGQSDPTWRKNSELLDGTLEFHPTLSVEIGPIKLNEKDRMRLEGRGAQGSSIPSDELPYSLKRAIKRVETLKPLSDLLKR